MFFSFVIWFVASVRAKVRRVKAVEQANVNFTTFAEQESSRLKSVVTHKVKVKVKTGNFKQVTRHS